MLVPMYVRAQECKKLPNGIVEILVERRELTPEESDIIRRLFPNLDNQAFEILDKEAVLQALPFHDEIKAARDAMRRDDGLCKEAMPPLGKAFTTKK